MGINNLFKVKMFEFWLEKNHPNFNTIFGSLILLMIFLFVISIVLCFWFDWWWKMSLVTLVMFGVIKLIQNITIKLYIEEYEKSK